MNQRTGFTLVELIVALALSAVLMTVLLTITRRVIEIQLHSAQLSNQMADTTELADQLRRDFLMASSIRLVPNGCLLAGAVQRDQQTLSMNHRDALIQYRIVHTPATDGLARLVRDQWLFDATSGRMIDQSSEPVWDGAHRLELTSNWIDAMPPSQPIEDAQILAPESVPHQMPPSLRLRLIGHDRRGAEWVIWDETVFHHFEG